MSIDDDEDAQLLAALATLPAPAQSEARQAATWQHVARALRATAPPRFRWFTPPAWAWDAPGFLGRHFVPATLLLGGLLYAGGAVRQLDRVFGGARGPAAAVSFSMPAPPRFPDSSRAPALSMIEAR